MNFLLDMNRARDDDHVVFTHDLDFGTLLAPIHSIGPSGSQVRHTRGGLRPHWGSPRRSPRLPP